MSKKSLLILSALLLVLAVISITLLRHEKRDWSAAQTGGGKNIFPALPVNDITEITIADSNNRVTLKQQNGQWQVVQAADYPADFAKIRRLVLLLKELRAMQIIPAGTSQFGRLQLLPPQPTGAKKVLPSNTVGTKVELKNSDGKLLAGMIIGKNYQVDKNSPKRLPFQFSSPAGRYLLPDGCSQPVAVKDDLSEASPLPKRWLQPGFIKIREIKSISATSPAKKSSWHIVRTAQNGKFKLIGEKSGIKLKQSAVRSLTSALEHLSFTDIADDITSSKALHKIANRVELKVTTFTGFIYHLTVAEKSGKAYLQVAVTARFPKTPMRRKTAQKADKKELTKQSKAKLADLKAQLADEQKFQHWIYVVPQYRIAELMKRRSELLQPPAKNPKPKSGKH